MRRAVARLDEELHDLDPQAQRRSGEGGQQDGVAAAAIKQQHIEQKSKGHKQDDIAHDVGQGNVFAAEIEFPVNPGKLLRQIA